VTTPRHAIAGTEARRAEDGTILVRVLCQPGWMSPERCDEPLKVTCENCKARLKDLSRVRLPARGG